MGMSKTARIPKKKTPMETTGFTAVNRHPMLSKDSQDEIDFMGINPVDARPRRLIKITVPDPLGQESECASAHDHQTTILVLSCLLFILMTGVLIWMCHERVQPPEPLFQYG